MGNADTEKRSAPGSDIPRHSPTFRTEVVKDGAKDEDGEDICPQVGHSMGMQYVENGLPLASTRQYS